MAEAVRIEEPHRGGMWLRPVVDGAPAVGFLATLLITRDFQKAAWVLLGLSILALGTSLIAQRRVAPIPAFSCAMAIVFATLAIVLHRNDLLQMKMTITDSALGALLFGGLAMRRNPLKRLLGQTLTLPDKAWRVLTIRYGLFFWASAAANEVIRRTQTTQVWAEFRIVAIVAAVAFGLAQLPFLKKNWVEPGEPDAPDPPESGF
ncbi:MAG TPA: septation protein IspZ [Caulobacteraceae bacterium]|jgi:intracellular septation protein